MQNNFFNNEIRIFLVFALFLSSCLNDTGSKEGLNDYDRDEFFTVDYEKILENKAEVTLAGIAKNIRYIRLETNDHCLLHMNAKYYFTDEYIFVNNVSHILMFDRMGKFIRQIGKPGRGPGEIGIIRLLSVLDNEKTLIVQTSWARKLYYFSYDGDFIRSVKVDDIGRIKILPQDRFLEFDECSWGNEEYMFRLTNSKGDTIDAVRNHYLWENKSGYTGVVSYGIFKPFYEYNGILSFKSMYNDTIYHIVGDSISPVYLIDMGCYKLPQEFRLEVIGGGLEEFKANFTGYRLVSVFEANETLYITSKEYSSIIGNNETIWNMVYDRHSDTGLLLVDTHGDPASFINDIDGGPDFWPTGAVNDSTIYQALLPHQVLKYKEPGIYTGETAHDPIKSEAFRNIINDVSEDDNPVLMVVTLIRTNN